MNFSVWGLFFFALHLYRRSEYKSTEKFTPWNNIMVLFNTYSRFDKQAIASKDVFSVSRDL